MTVKIRLMLMWGIQGYQSCRHKEQVLNRLGHPLIVSLEQRRSCTHLDGQRDDEYGHGDAHQQVTVAHQLLPPCTLDH